MIIIGETWCWHQIKQHPFTCWITYYHISIPGRFVIRCANVCNEPSIRSKRIEKCVPPPHPRLPCRQKKCERERAHIKEFQTQFTRIRVWKASFSVSYWIRLALVLCDFHAVITMRLLLHGYTHQSRSIQSCYACLFIYLTTRPPYIELAWVVVWLQYFL